MISNHSEGTFGLSPLPLGGDRPSQTARQTVSDRDNLSRLGNTRVVSQQRLHRN